MEVLCIKVTAGTLIANDTTEGKFFLRKEKKQSRNGAFARTHTKATLKEEDSEEVIDFSVKTLINIRQEIRRGGSRKT